MIRKESIALLKKSPYFTKQSLSLALGKEADNLDYWIKKMLGDGQLVALKKGLYISRDYLDMMSYEPTSTVKYYEYLANILRYPSYLSLEYVLAKYNFIPEAVFSLTSVTTKSSRSYTNAIGMFSYRSLKQSIFFGYESIDFRGVTVKIASLAKALFDFLYLRPFVSQWDMKDYLFSRGRINWDVLNRDQKADFNKIVERAGSKKIDKIANFLIKEGVL